MRQSNANDFAQAYGKANSWGIQLNMAQKLLKKEKSLMLLDKWLNIQLHMIWTKTITWIIFVIPNEWTLIQTWCESCSFDVDYADNNTL